MVRIIQNLLLMVGFAAICAVVLPMSYNYGKSNGHADAIESARPQVTVHERVLYADYGINIVNNCNVTIVAFLSNSTVEVSLKPIIIPKEKAISDYSDLESSLFIWKLEPTVPSGQYLFQTHVITECGSFSNTSVKTEEVLVDV